MTAEPTLITGAGGQLGHDLSRLLPRARALGRGALDITDEVQLGSALVGVETVFNCAAYNAVDRAEEDSAGADLVNHLGPARLARQCRQSGIRLIHFSTNYVFDGRASSAYSEADEPSPVGAYAQSKRAGEEAVLRECPGALVVRSSGLFGAVGSAVKGGSFPERIVASARAGRDLAVVGDQRLNPTWTGDLAAASLALARSGLTGIVHLVADGCASYFELAVATLELAGLQHVPVREVTSDAYPTAAPRPQNGCLTSNRVPSLPHWRQGLAGYWAAYQLMSPASEQPM
ncbi:MAG TPA: NAD(P)-dependent oxidoreductase [Candidatus Acidoferrales bacterium]|nr:NAD(P)-dependent oxidoreductase [Candidatus Acidoferrales bacterium]